MTIKKYSKQIIVIIVLILMCISTFSVIKLTLTENNRLYAEKEYSNNHQAAEATTREVITSNKYQIIEVVREDLNEEPVSLITAPKIVDDGSIIYDGLNVTELTEKLNRSLKGELSNTGYYFADYTRKTGLNPYLAVSIVLLETGCNWKCSKFVTECYNIGGLKGHGSCNGTSYSRYDSLDEGIRGYLDILYKGYFLKGKDTPETMASTYAQSSQWSNKVRNYMDQVRNK